MLLGVVARKSAPYLLCVNWKTNLYGVAKEQILGIAFWSSEPPDQSVSRTLDLRTAIQDSSCYAV